jgi:hypothetical protein
MGQQIADRIKGYLVVVPRGSECQLGYRRSRSPARKYCMDHQSVIADVQRKDGGVYVSFADGKNVFYSAALLYNVIPEAQEVHVSEEDD